MGITSNTNCPNCGAVIPPVHENPDNTCRFCNTYFGSSPKDIQVPKNLAAAVTPQVKRTTSEIISDINGKSPEFKLFKFLFGLFFTANCYLLLYFLIIIITPEEAESLIWTTIMVVCVVSIFIYLTIATFLVIKLNKDYRREMKAEGLQNLHPNRVLCMYLCTLTGFSGLHRIYAKKWGSGIFYMISLGGLGIGVLVDMILLSLGKFKDSGGNILY